MTLTPGTKLGPYEILSAAGSGGMGEVYRARDTRLDRIVAIKVLPEAVLRDPSRKQRLEREARAVSSLSHPHICTLYDIGNQDGVDYLVMEFLEGETLADRLAKGPLPLEQVLKHAVEIAGALDAAHRRGVVHRDLKPGNVMLTRSGAKVLDFGLAKLNTTSPASQGLSVLPTVENRPLTAEGAIVGTLPYMAPEQLQGEEADARTDIFAVGTMVYEMATGRRAFTGKSQASLIAAILEHEPQPLSSLRPMTPPSLDHLVKRCLAKDPEDRWQSARDLVLELEWISETGSQGNVTAPVGSQAKRREQVAWAVVALFILTSIALAVGMVARAPKVPRPMRLDAQLGANATLFSVMGSAAVFSPDGSRFAFVASGDDQTRRIYVRSLDQLQAVVVPGTENARDPFFSPDGQWLGFFADEKLKKVSVQGGAAVTICDSPNDRGGSWGEDGTIVFTPNNRVALSRVSAAGGRPEPLTALDNHAGEVTHRWPQILPGGKVVLFTSSRNGTNYEDAEIVAYSIGSGQRKTVQRGGYYGRYLPSGHVAFVHEGTLFAVPFDAERLEILGQPVPILDGVASTPIHGGAQFSFSDSGNLLYATGGNAAQNVSIFWMDPEGTFTPLRATPGEYYNPAFSPDGRNLALDVWSRGRADIWLDEWGRDTLTRLTFAGDGNVVPVWTPDGRRIAYSSEEQGGVYNLWWKWADGAGDAQRLTENRNIQFAQSWRPDGKVLAFQELNADTNWDILTLTVEGDETSGWKIQAPRPFVSTPYIEAEAAFAPDGHWLAYTSNESGKSEVYVRPFPGPGGKWEVSTDGGRFPEWSRHSKELFYRTEDSKIMVATYSETPDSFHTDKPRLWSPGQFTSLGYNLNFNVHPDGKRIAVLKAAGTTEAPKVDRVTLILDFFDELRRKAPPGKH